MRFGARDTVGLNAAQPAARMNPASLYLPVPVDIGSVASSVRSSATATASGTPHTKGSWTQITAATAAEATMIVLTITTTTSQSATNTSTLIDIGVGAAASEVVIVPDVPVGYLPVGAQLFLPVKVPAGSRVAFRAQSVVGSKTVVAHFDFWSLLQGVNAPGSLVTYTADTATSQGVTLAAPGGNNTKGAYTELVASTSVPLQALLVAAQCAGSTTTSNNITVDIAVGGSGSEVILPGCADLGFGASSVEVITNLYGYLPLPVNVPAGERLSARYQCSNSASNGIDLVVIGVPK